ncbi:GNAT family N-acetyltransferase [Lysinibacillus sp. KU-BSD001]|uniref:GNAT family N-acetyltransferase n=1 Tax=Lysinibacillus sp. KU-BSD001 TaxID=3141328 RepID=UPI0036E6A1FF
MEIEQLTENRLEETSKLLDEYRQFYEQPSDVAAAKYFLQQRLVNKDSIVFIAIIEHVTVGFVQLYPTFSTVGLKRAYILNDLYVSPIARQKGVAQALIERCFTFCEAQNARYITLETSLSNVHAQKIYEKVGMHIEDSVLHYIKYW